MNITQIRLSHFNQVVQTSWGGNDALYAPVQGLNLRILWRSTVTANGTNSDGSSKSLALLHDLHRQFTRGRQNEQDWLGKALTTGLGTLLEVLVKGGEQESARFSGSSLCDANHILVLQGNGPGLGLNGRGMFESGGFEGKHEFIVVGRIGKLSKGIGELGERAMHTVTLHGNIVGFAPFREGQVTLGRNGLFFGGIYGSGANALCCVGILCFVLAKSTDTLDFLLVFGRVEFVDLTPFLFALGLGQCFALEALLGRFIFFALGGAVSCLTHGAAGSGSSSMRNDGNEAIR